jgi:hypothetical protein
VQVLLDRLGSRLDVEGVLGDLPRDARHFCRSPYKHVIVALEEVNELTFLFGAQAGSDLDSLCQLLGVDLDDLGVLDCLEGARRGGHGRISQREWCAEA